MGYETKIVFQKVLIYHLGSFTLVNSSLLRKYIPRRFHYLAAQRIIAQYSLVLVLTRHHTSLYLSVTATYTNAAAILLNSDMTSISTGIVTASTTHILAILKLLQTLLQHRQS